MSDGSESARKPRAPIARLWGEMATWKKTLLAVFLLIGLSGAVLRAPAWMDRPPETPFGATATDQAPPTPGGRAFVDTRTAPTPPNAPAPGEPDPQPQRPLPWTAHLGGWLASLGLSFAGGLVLGVFFRSFLKTMAAITAVIVAGIIALSYLEVINVDMTTMQQNYESFSAWLSGQAAHLRGMAASILPSAGMAILGFIVGFIRR